MNRIQFKIRPQPRCQTIPLFNLAFPAPAHHLAVAALLVFATQLLATAGTRLPELPKGRTAAPISWSDLGAKATAQYSGNGLAVSATKDGARLRCVFQKLEGEVTREGLWLRSTSQGSKGERFRVVAKALGRKAAMQPLPSAGTVEVQAKQVWFVRPGIVEEYSVSIDGVRQDFVVEKRPPGDGGLRVELQIAGARVEKLANGIRLRLKDTGRQIDYNRVQAFDRAGKELSARMDVVCSNRVAVVVDDVSAVYPVWIDPTFSDANWISMGDTIPGANSDVYAAVTDDNGNLYVGGSFTLIGSVTANRVAKWDGTNWSALGTGVSSSLGDAHVDALVVSGSDLYVGGEFLTAGGISATRIAKWNGTNWSALGSGMNLEVHALAVSEGTLYAGGEFSTAGGIGTGAIAKWDGTNWSALGWVMSGDVLALAVMGGDLYAGGSFAAAGGVSGANYIAKWDGTNWSSLGSGVNGVNVSALAVSGNDLYAGGNFWRAGGVSANYIAKWDGTDWSALGSGMDSYTIHALTVSGSCLYAAGTFTKAGGVNASYIAKPERFS